MEPAIPLVKMHQSQLNETISQAQRASALGLPPPPPPCTSPLPLGLPLPLPPPLPLLPAGSLAVASPVGLPWPAGRRAVCASASCAMGLHLCIWLVRETRRDAGDGSCTHVGPLPAPFGWRRRGRR